MASLLHILAIKTLSPLLDQTKSSWDPIWEEVHASQAWGKYPPEELIRFIARNFYKAPRRQDVSLLELGCGAGACLWFMAREGFTVTGLDGSPSALHRAEELLTFNHLSVKLICDDVANLKDLFPSNSQHAIVDICCLQHNRPAQIVSILDQVYDVLVPGGHFFSMMVSTESYGYGLGREVEPGTFDQISDGPLHNRGLTHFFTQDEIRRLLVKFQSVEVDFTQRSFQNGQMHYKNWVCTGMKPI